MIIGGVVEWLIGINAEGKSLERRDEAAHRHRRQAGDGVITEAVERPRRDATLPPTGVSDTMSSRSTSPQ